MKKILIANRGEIAVRITRAAAESGFQTVAVYSADDANSFHLRTADECWELEGKGVAAYLNIDQIIKVALEKNCDAIHPGYGFLSENDRFARRCRAEGLNFIGPDPEILELFGDKTRARLFAQQCGMPMLPGTYAATSLEQAIEFFESLGPDAAVMIKAVMGGGGRGMRAVYERSALEEAYIRCQSEARAAFGNGDVYIEKLIRRPRHVEVQIVGDGKEIVHLGERDCTIQRRHQKLIEISPCPNLSSELREKITESALLLARQCHYQSLGTVEFLLDEDKGTDTDFFFMEVNPRLQVEHTVTEELTGVDLVRAQIGIASGQSLTELGLKDISIPRDHYAMQLRINMETIDDTGSATPNTGTLSLYESPSGPGIRVDGYGYSGYKNNPSFDSLLAKLIVVSRSKNFTDVVAKAIRALREFRIEGIETNLPFLFNLLQRPEMANNDFYTHYIEDYALELSTAAVYPNGSLTGNLLNLQSEKADQLSGPEGSEPIRTPITGRVVSINVAEGDLVCAGQTLAIIEAMKMEHEIKTNQSGYVFGLQIAIDDIVGVGDPILFLIAKEVAGSSTKSEREIDLDYIRPDLEEVIERHSYGLDEMRPKEVDIRHENNQRTARENIEDLCDLGSFIEYGALAIAAQRQRRSIEDLIKKTPADGLVAGIGSVNGSIFGPKQARCMVMSYDYSVLAGTQGYFNHKKMDRMLKIAHEQNLPLVLFAEGGGGRPGDVDANAVAVAGLDLSTFGEFAALSGKSPLVGIVAGPCFAGNAALLGCCDVIIATANSTIGMGGPVMIEGGGLGSYRPEEIGPINIQSKNGVVDIVVADEAEAVASAKKYLSYFQGPISQWESADQRLLRQAVPDNRLRVYDIRALIEILADKDSVLELRPDFSPGMITALVSIEGRPMGIIANNPKHISGAIEADGADKAARFMQICNAFGLPIISLCDTPGFMVGPDIEAKAQVRHVCRMFVIGSNLSVPYFTVVLRKGYGLGAMAMARGGFHNSFFTTSWPTGEFGGMGLEGAVKAGFKKELQSITDPKEQDQLYRKLVNQLYEMGKAVNMASYLEIDSVIDPVDTRRWILRGLDSSSERTNSFPVQAYIDTW